MLLLEVPDTWTFDATGTTELAQALRAPCDVASVGLMSSLVLFEAENFCALCDGGTVFVWEALMSASDER